MIVKRTLKSLRKALSKRNHLPLAGKKKTPKQKKKVITLITLVSSKSHMRHIQVY